MIADILREPRPRDERKKWAEMPHEERIDSVLEYLLASRDRGSTKAGLALEFSIYDGASDHDAALEELDCVLGELEADGLIVRNDQYLSDVREIKHLDQSMFVWWSPSGFRFWNPFSFIFRRRRRAGYR